MSPLIPVLLLCTASVVEYNVAREVIYRCGYGARREGDNLVVLSEQTSRSLYVKPNQEGVTEVGRLYVDEGTYDGCLNGDIVNGTTPIPVSSNMNRPWEELVDATNLARLVCRCIAPAHVYKDHGLMGRGSGKRAMQEQYLEVMRANIDMLRAMGFKVEEVPNPV